MSLLISDVSADDIVETVRSALVVLDADMRVRSANRAFYALFQVTPEATIGYAIDELGDRQWNLPLLRERLEAVIPADEPMEAFEVEHDFETIGRRWLILNARKVFRPGNHMPFLLLAIDDVSETREAERLAELNWRLAQNIVDTVRDPLVVLETDFTVVTASPAFLRLFGVSGESVAGRRLRDLGEGQWNVSALRDLLDRVVSDREAFDGFEIEDDFPHLGRRIFKLNARKVIHPGVEYVARLLLVFEDVTEARLLERHRDLLAAELSHRIKNSLQIISSFAGFELRRAPEACVGGYRAMQGRIGAVAQLYDLISRSSAFGPVPMAPYLDGIASSLRSSLLDESSKVVIRVEAEPLAVASEHAVSLGLIVNELATNAVKYAFPQSEGEIVLGFACVDGAAVLAVSDNGVGVAAAVPGPSGTSGLGSRFVEAFAQQLGGVLAEDSTAEGTRVTVRLPSSILAEA